MVGSSEMFPFFSTSNLASRASADAEAGRDLGETFLGMNNLKGNGIVNFGHAMRGSNRSPAMGALIHLVLGWRGPPNVFWVDAAEVTVPAPMGGVMFRSWWRAMDLLTHNPSRAYGGAVDANLRNAGGAVSIEWPDQAIFVLKANMISDEFHWRTTRCFLPTENDSGVAVSFPSAVVFCAPALGFVRSAASIYRAYICHVSQVF